MSFRSTLKLDSKFFHKQARQQAFGAAVVQTAKEFKNELKQKMIAGPHTGKITTRGKTRGANFTRQHRAARRGERPAPDTKELIDSIQSSRTGETSAKVEITAEHGEHLQNKDFLVMTAEDVAEADKNFNQKAQSALLSLI